MVSWNSKHETEKSIQRVLNSEGINVQIAVVDNNSSDGTCDYIKSNYPEVRLIENDENKGFSSACNQGIEHFLEQDVNFIFLLNTDLYVNTQTLACLTDAADKSQQFGAISPVVYHNDDDKRVWFEQGCVNWTTSASFHQTNGAPLIYSQDSDLDRSDERFVGNDYIPFCSALFRPRVFKEVGMLPESYFLYYEDVDYCTQLSDHGYKIITDTQTSVQHEESASSGGRRSPTATYYTARNHIQFAMRFRNRINIPVSIIWIVIWLSLLFGYRIITKQPEAAFAVAYGIYDGLCGRTGRFRYPQ